MGMRFVDPEPQKKTVEDIIVCGKRVGKIDITPPTEYRRTVNYHAAINLEMEGLTGGFSGLIQGHGDTREAAVAEAIEKATVYAKTLLVAVEDFRRQLDVKEEVEPQ